NAAHCFGVCASSASFTSSALGERLGNQTSYQSCVANSDFGTPRGGRRTVPMRRPSFFVRGVPRRTMRMVMSKLPYCSTFPCRQLLLHRRVLQRHVLGQPVGAVGRIGLA